MATSSKKTRKPAASSKASATRKPASSARPAVKQAGAKKKAAKKAANKAPTKAPGKRVAAAKTSQKTSQKISKAVAPVKPKPLKAIPRSPLMKVIEAALADMKAVDIKVLDVRGLTDVADSMVIASGNSDRHVRSIAENVVMAAKKAGFRPMGTEGERDGEWALVDLHDVIVHVMLPRIRDLYRLESLWDISAARREAVQG